MSATSPLFVNLSAPARSSLVQGFALLSSPAMPSYVLRDTVRVEARFMSVTAGSRTGVAADIGETAVLRIGGKVKSSYVTDEEYVFFAEFTRDDSDPQDIFYYADLDLNTEEFIAAFDGAGSVALIVELEVELAGAIQTVAQFDATGIFDVIRPGTPDPTPSVPPYPTAPSAYPSLLGSTGSVWKQYTLAELLAFLLTIRRTSVAGGEPTSLANAVVSAAMEGLVLKVASPFESYPTVCQNQEFTLYEDATSPADDAATQKCLAYNSSTLPYVWRQTA